MLPKAAQERCSAILCPLTRVQVRDSGKAGDGSYTISGHAAVFNKLSLDLGGFQEKIDPGAFTNVLARNPSVLAVWDHDTRLTLGNTANGTVELKQDDQGLLFWARVAPTSYAADLRILLERGDISQCSFMFAIERERYEIVGEGDRQMVVFTIEEIAELYDVTVTGRGAYPQTDVEIIERARKLRLENALQENRAPAGRVLSASRTSGSTTEEPPSRIAGGDGAATAHRQAVERARQEFAQVPRPKSDTEIRLAHRQAAERARLDFAAVTPPK